uniref:COMM domain-containing protein n=1 Tax=Homalodisca liturata TaxID=320908 RepID=A0A1B6JP07_9HEMI
MSSLFGSSITPGLQSGIDVINTVDSQKFPLVLNRVAQCIQTKSDDLKPFSTEEVERLSTTLSISQSELQLMLDCSTLILKQAAFNVTKPAVLQQQLSEHFKLNEDKVDAFVSTWTNQAKNIVGAIKQKSIHPKQVEGVSWLLNTAVSSDTGLLLEPRAVVELKLRQSDSGKGNLRLDLDQSQLQRFYETLETIQSSLDNLR